MTGLIDHLRGQILGSPGKCLPLSSPLPCIAPPKIRQFDESFRVQKNIFRFEVPMYNRRRLRVHVVQCQHHIVDCFGGLLNTKPFLLLEGFVELPPLTKLKNQVKKSVVFEVVVEGNDARILQGVLNLDFVVDLLYHLANLNLVLPDLLDGVDLPRHLMLDLKYVSEGAFPQPLQHLKVGELGLVLKA